MSWDSVVDTVTMLRVGRSGVLIPVGMTPSCPKASVRAVGLTEPPIQWALVLSLLVVKLITLHLMLRL
jgi:hypothetical protein